MKCSFKKTPPEPSTLELRIHGVRNTPPHELLRSGKTPIATDDVELSWGDELAGFYRAKTGTGAPPDGAGARVVEAYSWGRLARFTGVSVAGKIADALVRTAWFLLMPFGLTNTAYWSRPLPRVRLQPESAKAGAALMYAEDARHGGDGAGRIRLFALVLTLYFVVTAAVVSLDLIAVQCFPADVAAREDQICSTLPAFLDGLTLWTRGQRIALFAVVPLLGMGVLAAVAYLARTRYHPRPNLSGPAAGAGIGAGPHVAVPTLTIPNLWEARREIRYNGWLHVWATVAAMAAIVAWDGLVSRHGMDACVDLDTFFSKCIPQFAPERMGRVWSSVVGSITMGAWLLGALAVAGAAIETVRKSADNPDLPSRGGRPWRGPIAAAAILSAAGAGGASIVAPGNTDGEGKGMAGLSAAPAGLMAAMLVLIAAMYLLSRKGYDLRALGWRGKGSAVFSTLALGAATILSSAVVGAAVTLLQGNLVRRSTSDDAMWRYGAPIEEVLAAPPVFRLFGGVLLAVIFVAAVVWGLSSWLAVRAMSWNTEDAAVDDLLDAYGAARPLAQERAAGRKLAASRRTASLAHRAEAIAALVTLLIFLGLLASLVLAIFTGDSKTGWLAEVAGLVGSLGALGLAAAGAGILTLAVMSARPNSRPLALLWDLMCFMPKAAHPFGPPSYGERAVPEFAARIGAWLEGAEGSPPRGTGKVAISAHSLGAIIAVAALFHLKATRPGVPFERIGLLTYGTQLRPYFGRFFPELFGPAVLSTAPVGRTGLRAPGGPLSERESLHSPSGPACLNLGSILGPGRSRWINLYRKTDYLGFPVLYRGSGGTECVDTDPYAQEMDPYTYQFMVVSHSDYLQTPQYEQAIATVISGLPAPQQ